VTLPPSELVTAHSLDPEEEIPRLFAHLRTQVDGLDEREAARRLQQVGPNEIRRESGSRRWRSQLDQFTHPLALLLWLAAGLSLITGVISLAVAIVVVIVLNAAFAFMQERQAEHATEALRDLLPPRARVRRDGALVEIDARAARLLPGDRPSGAATSSDGHGYGATTLAWLRRNDPRPTATFHERPAVLANTEGALPRLSRSNGTRVATHGRL
jgi:hypothetical protein